MVAGVLASLAELELELGRERRAAARDARRARGQAIGRPKALDQSKSALAQRMHTSGESANTIAKTLGVSRATVYRVLAERAEGADQCRQTFKADSSSRAASSGISTTLESCPSGRPPKSVPAMAPVAITTTNRLFSPSPEADKAAEDADGCARCEHDQ